MSDIQRMRIPAGRLRTIIDGPFARGDYILYWMQKAQRVAFNPALELAASLASQTGLPLLVLFVLTPYPGATEPHYRFMLEGLKKTASELSARNVHFSLQSGAVVPAVARQVERAAVLVTDAPRLPVERTWRRELSLILAGNRIERSTTKVAGPAGSPQDEPLVPLTVRPCPWFEVETEALVPPLLVSTKEEWAARTIRPKILRLLPEWLVEPEAQDWCMPASRMPSFETHTVSWSGFEQGMDGAQAPWKSTISATTSGEGNGRIAEQRISIEAGHAAAGTRLDRFLVEDGLARYAAVHNDPCADAQSGLSAYLHFGQISPLEIALAVIEETKRASHKSLFAGLRATTSDSVLERLSSGSPGGTAFLEQLIVRRELAANFALFNPSCLEYESAVPAWAQAALESSKEEREDRYSLEELEAAQTDDPYWNAAQNQMVFTGSMHNYMRMYWGKRLLLWRRQPAEAFGILRDFNDRYSLDGRDPNGYAGVAWCFGRHDRPWPARVGYGTVRSMSPDSLARKFDMESYTSAITMLYTDKTYVSDPQRCYR